MTVRDRRASLVIDNILVSYFVGQSIRYLLCLRRLGRGVMSVFCAGISSGNRHLFRGLALPPFGKRANDPWHRTDAARSIICLPEGFEFLPPFVRTVPK